MCISMILVDVLNTQHSFQESQSELSQDLRAEEEY